MEQHEQESVGLLTLLAKIDEHKTKLVYTGGAIVAIIAIIYTVQYFEKLKEFRANAALFALNLTESSDEAAEDLATSAQLLKVAEDYPATKAGARALLLAAARAYQEADYARAEGLYKDFQGRYSDNSMLPQAALGTAASIEAQGKQDQALTAYANILTQFKDTAVTAQAKLGVARLSERKGDLQRAYDLYDEVADPTQRSAWSFVARPHRDRLLSENPDLAKPEATSTNAVNSLFAPATSGALGSGASPTVTVQPVTPTVTTTATPTTPTTPTTAEPETTTDPVDAPPSDPALPQGSDPGAEDPADPTPTEDPSPDGPTSPNAAPEPAPSNDANADAEPADPDPAP